MTTHVAAECKCRWVHSTRTTSGKKKPLSGESIFCFIFLCLFHPLLAAMPSISSTKCYWRVFPVYTMQLCVNECSDAISVQLFHKFTHVPHNATIFPCPLGSYISQKQCFVISCCCFGSRDLSLCTHVKILNVKTSLQDHSWLLLLARVKERNSLFSEISQTLITCWKTLS